MNCRIFDNIELKISIKIINKGRRRKKSITIHQKSGMEIRTRERSFTLPKSLDSSQPGTSIKEKIKFFSEETSKKEVYKEKAIPGKLKIPSLFLKGNEQKNNDSDENESEVNSNIIDIETNEDNENK